MTTLTTYQCDGCKAVYATEEEATACEAQHHAPNLIMENEYISKDTGGYITPAYPWRVKLRMDNGKTLWYEVSKGQPDLKR